MPRQRMRHRLASLLLAAAGLGVFAGTLGAVLIPGTPRADTYRGGPGADTIRGAGGEDVIVGLGGADRLFGDAGKDKILGGPGNDAVSGGAGDDALDGGAGNDTVRGDAGDDTLFGGSGDDLVDGGGGVDAMTGGSGNDRLQGGAGTDVLQGAGGKDQLNGGVGNDLADSADDVSDVVVCGAGQDLVLADTVDRVRADCEAVDRSDEAKRIVAVAFAGRNWTRATKLEFPTGWVPPGGTLTCPAGDADRSSNWVFYMYRGIAKGDRLLITWRAGSDIFNSVATKIPNPGTGVESFFTKFNDDRPLPNGLWEVEVAVNGRVLNRIGFRRAC